MCSDRLALNSVCGMIQQVYALAIVSGSAILNTCLQDRFVVACYTD